MHTFFWQLATVNPTPQMALSWLVDQVIPLHSPGPWLSLHVHTFHSTTLVLLIRYTVQVHGFHFLYR